MMKLFAGVALIMGLALTTTSMVDAKGCFKGAVVGGVAGHFAHHPILGAIAGCAVGHHEAVKKEHEQRAAALKAQQAQHTH